MLHPFPTQHMAIPDQRKVEELGVKQIDDVEYPRELRCEEQQPKV